MKLSFIAWITTTLPLGALAFVTKLPTASVPAMEPSTTARDAAPIMIISPILKKMKEEEAKRKLPMADADEAAKEAPGLRVGRDAWKWPAIWPYDNTLFQPSGAAPAQNNINNMASMLSGIANVPTSKGESTFDALQFWREEQQRFEIDPEAADKLREHYSYYIQDGMSVLEFGASRNSYLPEGLELARHVGVGAVEEEMKENPALTSSMVIDLNKVIKGRDIDSDDLRVLAQEPFDVIIMNDLVEFLSSPREVFRSAWYLLKPGGKLLASFSSRDFMKDYYTDAQTSMWKTYNDDQHMWMVGSFFQFSAGEGWEDLLGFDVSPDSAVKLGDGENPVAKAMSGKKNNNMYVVQATKGFQDKEIDPENLERSIGSLCWMLPVMEERDRTLVVKRLVRAYETAESEDVYEAIGRNVQHLPKIYEALVKMDRFAFTFSMQAQMAVDLVCDPDFCGSEEQIMSLKQGLGLRTPSKEFWEPVGMKTAAMQVEDKISLLAYIVPCFGSGDPTQEQALQDFVSGLQPTYDTINAKCPDITQSDLQLIGTELLANEILKPNRSTKEEFARWLNAMSAEDITSLLKERKSIREIAKLQLKEYKQSREEEEKRIEELRKKFEAQKENARLTRTMIFNPKTQKMEKFDNPNLKK